MVVRWIKFKSNTSIGAFSCVAAVLSAFFGWILTFATAFVPRAAVRIIESTDHGQFEGPLRQIDFEARSNMRAPICG